MKTHIILLFMLCYHYCGAQEYIIKHDKLTEQTSYYKIVNYRHSPLKKDTVKIDQIYLKKPSQISLQVNNFNPFYWGARASIIKNSEDASGSSSVFNPFNLFSKVMEGLMPGRFPFLDISMDKSRGTTADSPEGKMLVLVSDYNRTYNEIKSLSLQYNNFKSLEWQLNQLKFDIKKSEDEIKSTARDAVAKVIPVNQLSPEGILILGTSMDNRARDVTDSASMLKLQISQAAVAVPVDHIISDDKTANDVLVEIEKGKTSTELFMQKTSANPNLFTEEILSVGKLYNEIANTPFSYNYKVSSDADINQIKLALYPRTDAESKDTITKYFAIKTRNSIRLRNSIGLIFTYFGNSDHSFFTGKDSAITQGRGDLFVPAIGTFLNFYRSGTNNFKWGGSIGFGLPISGNIKELQFLLGICTVFGKNEPIVFSFGLTGGKVNKLKDGLQIGDKVPPEYSSNLTKSVYGIGSFFSLSINMSAFSQRR